MRLNKLLSGFGYFIALPSLVIALGIPPSPCLICQQPIQIIKINRIVMDVGITADTVINL